jgi:hypothetical protein
LSLRIGGAFTSNRDGSATNKQSNLDGLVEPRADFLYQDADRTSAQLTLTPVLKWHSHPRTAAEGGAQPDTELFGSLGLELMHRLTPTVSLSAGDQVTYNDDPQVIEGETPGGNSVRRSQSYVRNTAHAGANSALTMKLGAGLAVDNATTRYVDRLVAKESDSDSLGGKATAHYFVGSGWTLLGLVSMSEYQDKKAEHGQEAVTMTYDAGIRKTFTPDFTAEALGGYQAVDYDDPDLDSSHTMNGNADVVFQSTAPTRFRLAAGYGYTPPNTASRSAQETTTASGTVDHDVLSDRLTVSLQGQYTDGHYRNEGDDAPAGSEKMTRLGVHGTYRWNNNWSLTGGYSFERWESTERASFDRILVDANVRTEW